MKEQALKDRLRVISKEKGMQQKECWKKLFFERFLFSLSRSPLRELLIFKGGTLLSYLFRIGRETLDLDFLLTKIKAEKLNVQKAFEEIISEKTQDGFVFSFEKIEILDQPHMFYPGYRITLKVIFGSIQDQIKIDVGIGDVVEPENKILPLFKYRGKPMFAGEISLLVYPPESIFAEKLETAIAKGSTNSRVKDYHDLLLLVRQKELININKLRAAILSTFKNRNTPISFIEFDRNELKEIQNYWTKHLKDLDDIAQDLDLPQNIAIVIEEINNFILPILPNFSLSATIAKLKGNLLTEIVKTAIAAGADVNDNSYKGHRPLQLALKRGYTEIAKLLIENGADPTYQDRSGLTPLQTAINCGRSQFENAKLLINKGAVLNQNDLKCDYTKLYEFINFFQK